MILVAKPFQQESPMCLTRSVLALSQHRRVVGKETLVCRRNQEHEVGLLYRNPTWGPAGQLNM